MAVNTTANYPNTAGPASLSTPANYEPLVGATSGS